MSNTLDEFKEKFSVNDLTIWQSQSWTWSLRPVHSTVGAGVLSLNRFSKSFGDMTASESADLGEITRKIEATLRRSFDHDKINYLMLMMVDAHLHFHVIPRYSRSIERFGHEWHDSGWPALPNLAEDQSEGERDIRILVRDALRANAD